ncbi:MAG: DUF3800 domain-containing protein [candidate division WOR-3 bacterium]
MRGLEVAMPEKYNIYCDESCHLEHDRCDFMGLGAIWCRSADASKLASLISGLAARYNAKGELKWNKVSKSRQAYYIELVDLFFRTPGLHFRCLVVENKSRLEHEQFNRGSHDSFYYKMYYYLLRNIVAKGREYKIYLDAKDTRGSEQVRTLHEVLCRGMYDFEYRTITEIPLVRSHDLRLLQLADFLTGAVVCHNRGIKVTEAKRAVIKRILDYLPTDLRRSTPPWEEKFNLFVFTPTEVKV